MSNPTLTAAEIKQKNNKELALYLERGHLVRDSMKHMSDLRSSIFQLTNYYIVFQAVILSAFANSNTALSSEDLYFLAGLSAIPAFLNICAIYFLGKEFIKANAEHQTYLGTYNALYSKLYVDPANCGDDGTRVELHEDHFKKTMCQCVLSVFVILLVFFLGIVIVACVMITGRELNHDKALLRVTEKDEKCARFCVAWWKEVGRLGQPNP